MGSHPLNLGLRFGLELAALGAIGWWGWAQSDNWLRFVWAIGLPLLAAIAWGLFNVPGDPSRSGQAPVKVPGVVRLLIEGLVFGAAIAALFYLGQPVLGGILAVLVAGHYVLSWDRIGWLITR